MDKTVPNYTAAKNDHFEWAFYKDYDSASRVSLAPSRKHIILFILYNVRVYIAFYYVLF